MIRQSFHQMGMSLTTLSTRIALVVDLVRKVQFQMLYTHMEKQAYDLIFL